MASRDTTQRSAPNNLSVPGNPVDSFTLSVTGDAVLADPSQAPKISDSRVFLHNMGLSVSCPRADTDERNDSTVCSSSFLLEILLTTNPRPSP